MSASSAASSSGSEGSSDESSTLPATKFAPAAGRRTFEDEEGNNSDVLDSWDAAEDSEVEREKARKAKAATDAAVATAAAAKQSKKERIAQHQAARARQLVRAPDSDEESESARETPAEHRARLRREEIASDLLHAQDLVGDSDRSRGTTTTTTTATPAAKNTAAPAFRSKPVAIVAIASDQAAANPATAANVVDLATLPLFRPATKSQFDQLRDTLASLVTASASKAHYPFFLNDLIKLLAQDLNSEQIRRLITVITVLGNEKQKSEKEADKSNKRSKAQKTKNILVASRPKITDVASYDDNDFGDDDFI